MEKRDLPKNAPSPNRQEKLIGYRAKAKQIEAARELQALYEQEKDFDRTINAIDHTIKTLSDLQKPQNNMPDNMRKYLTTVLEQSRKATLDIRRVAKIGQVDTNYQSELQKRLVSIENDLNRFQRIMSFRSKTPTAQDILDRYSPNIPEGFLKDYESRKTLYWKKLQELQKKVEETHEKLEKFLEAPNEHITNLVKGSSICIGTDSECLQESLEQGRLTSHISRMPLHRLLMEQALYGFPQNLPPELRPLEGYLTSDTDGLHHSKQFKSAIIVHLKASVAERTTFTLSASQRKCTDGMDNLKCRPVPYNQPSIDAFPLDTERLESSYASLLELSKAKHIEDFPCQAQILGGVSIDDVAKVTFTSPRHRDVTLEALLGKRGIPYRLVAPEKYELNMDWVTEHLAVGGRIHPDEIEALAPQKIANVLNLWEAPDDTNALEREKIDWSHLPTPDRHPLDPRLLEKGTNWINERLDRGEGVLVHCKYGIGRSVIMVAAVLITRGVAIDQAFQLIRKQRWVAQPNYEQIKQLANWVGTLASSFDHL